jgi:hypothetical protein
MCFATALPVVLCNEMPVPDVFFDVETEFLSVI